VFELEEEKANTDIFWLLAFKVPFVSVKIDVEVLPPVYVSANCHAPPTPLKVMGLFTVTPFEVMVLVPEVELIVITPVPVGETMPEPKVKLPLTVKEFVPVPHVPVNPVKSKLSS
jgi:hypothetical protein